MNRRPSAGALLLAAFLVATCGLVYELVAGALASYLLGDSVTQFSLVIGVYLSAMGAGSWLSRFVRGELAAAFVRVEMLVGVVGGFSAAVLFCSFERIAGFRLVLFLLVAAVGILVGMEIPLLMRLLKDRIEFAELVSRVLAFDYAGALAASVLFPLWLVPHLGLMRTGLLFGVINLAVALATLHLFRAEIRRPARLWGAGLAALAALLAGFAGAGRLERLAEGAQFPHAVILARQSAYQRIVLTRERDELRLYLNGQLQFSSLDEYRYHEALVHPGLAAVAAPRRVLVLGGGDGLAVREILRHPEVESVTLVDLDPAMTRLFREQPMLRALNAGALLDPRVRVVGADAYIWLRANRESFDFAIADFPDPTNYSIGKLYTTAFYRELSRALAPGGLMVVQSTSPLFARRSFWCIDRTLRAAGLATLPYHAYVPSFGEWGFVLAGRETPHPGDRYPAGLRFLSAETFAALARFPVDMTEVDGEINRLDNQALVLYYEAEWARYAA